jgi:hypothetical protein
MSSFDEGLAVGLAIGKKKFSGGEIIEKEVGWTYPDGWPELPEAGTGETVLMIQPSEKYNKISLCLETDEYSKIPDSYNVTVDWGDGEQTEANELGHAVYDYPEHEYSEEFYGKYIFITIYSPEAYADTSDDHKIMVYTSVNGFYKTSSSNCYISYVLAACVGNRAFSINTRYPFNPVYTKFMIKELTETTANNVCSDSDEYGCSGYYRNSLYTFGGSYTKRIDFKYPPEYLGGYYCPSLTQLRTVTGLEQVRALCVNNYTFSQWSSILKIELPSLTALAANSFVYCASLEEVYLTSCGEIAENAFNTCTFLRKVVVPTGCVISENAFNNCNQCINIVYV